MVELLVLVSLFLVLFILSLIADRVWYAETLAKCPSVFRRSH